MSEELLKVVIPALIGAFVAIITFLIKDIFLQKRKERRDLIDRKLSELYGPLYTVCVMGQSTIATFLMDDKIYEKLISNLHLLSPQLQELLNKYNSLGSGNFRNPQFTTTAGREALEISRLFTERLEHELEEMRKAYK